MHGQRRRPQRPANEGRAAGIAAAVEVWRNLLAAALVSRQLRQLSNAGVPRWECARWARLWWQVRLWWQMRLWWQDACGGRTPVVAGMCCVSESYHRFIDMGVFQLSSIAARSWCTLPRLDTLDVIGTAQLLTRGLSVAIRPYCPQFPPYALSSEVCVMSR